MAGIQTLLDAAKYEHSDISVLKHLLAAASFAKKFCDASRIGENKFKDLSSKYVNVVKHSIVLTKLRSSQIFARAMTYKQFENVKAKNMIRPLLKFRDY